MAIDPMFGLPLIKESKALSEAKTRNRFYNKHLDDVLHNLDQEFDQRSLEIQIAKDNAEWFLHDLASTRPGTTSSDPLAAKRTCNHRPREHNPITLEQFDLELEKYKSDMSLKRKRRGFLKLPNIVREPKPCDLLKLGDDTESSLIAPADGSVKLVPLEPACLLSNLARYKRVMKEAYGRIKIGGKT